MLNKILFYFFMSILLFFITSLSSLAEESSDDSSEPVLIEPANEIEIDDSTKDGGIDDIDNDEDAHENND